LASQGIKTDEIVVYKTVEHPELNQNIRLLPELPIKAVFFSPSGLDSVLPLLVENHIDLQKIQVGLPLVQFFN